MKLFRNNRKVADEYDKIDAFLENFRDAATAYFEFDVDANTYMHLPEKTQQMFNKFLTSEKTETRPVKSYWDKHNPLGAKGHLESDLASKLENEDYEGAALLRDRLQACTEYENKIKNEKNSREANLFQDCLGLLKI